VHNSETEDDQPKTSYDMKLTVNLDRLEVTLGRKETSIVGAVIEGKISRDEFLFETDIRAN
jgi:hypothetical protein